MRVYQLPKAEGIDDLTLTEAAEPVPQRGQVLVRMRATSLNYRDLMIVEGRYARAQVRPNLVPLSDGAGEVVAVGPDVTRFTPGDRVAGIFHQAWLAGEVSDAILGSALGGDLDGTLTEYRVFEAEGLVHLPSHLSYEEGATLPCAAVTAWNALFGQRRVQPGDTVLTLGTGGVSIFAIQFAHAAGARVIATSSSDEKLDRAAKLGADDLINYKRTPDWDEQVRQLTEGRGVDHVVEVGGAGTLPRSLQAVRRGGQVNVIGLLAGGGEIDPMIVLGRSILMRGIFVGSREMFEVMNRALALRKLRPVIDRVFPFEQAAEAYRHLASGAHLGKVVVTIE
ncbi:MAG: NAD(P)-dependent alcohol dehydrogenase [Phycisphaeraceae bacterium]